MREKLVNRVGRLISGSFNAVVDAIESTAPETVMEQAIREIDSAIEDVRKELGKVIANKHLANKRLMEENRRHEDLSEKIKFAIAEGREDLAETAIAKQIDIEAQIPILEATIADGTDQEKELEGYIAALQAKKREMGDELRHFKDRMKEANAAQKLDKTESDPSATSVEGKVANAESAFERIIERTTGIQMPGQRTDRKAEAQLAELEEMARSRKIKDRLMTIKNGMEAE